MKKEYDFTNGEQVYKLIIKSIFDDFDSFFIEKKHEKYRYVFDKKDELKVYRSGSKSYLNIPEDTKFLDLDRDDEKVYLLFLIGHEMAHLVNKHLNYKDKNSLDSRSIEMWADFFGAKISMSILLNNGNFKQLINSDLSNMNNGIELLSYMLKKINKIYKNTNKSDKYLHSNIRLASTISGIMSYLTRDEMWRIKNFSDDSHAKIGTEWAMSISLKLSKIGTFDNILEEKNEYNIYNINLNVVKIHQEIKDGRKGYLIKGLKNYYNFILDSSYKEYKQNTLLVDKVNKICQELSIKR